MTVPPLDEIGHGDRVLMAEVGKLNERLGHYILRYLAADASRAEPVSATDERKLADAMITLAGKVLERANRRGAASTPPVLESDGTLRRLTNSRPSER